MSHQWFFKVKLWFKIKVRIHKVFQHCACSFKKLVKTKCKHMPACNINS